ncbi:MAG: RNA polymerase sigma factor [Phycisphaerales bacterium]|nr:MAG: RNA polymerase sigma factor [Phycisphaerales bacterium]
MKDAESELVARVKKGDMAALEALYRKHVDRVWRYAWFRTHSREDAAEIVQETFLRVLRSIGEFEGRSSFTTWLHAIARSVAIDLARRERRHRSGSDPETTLRLVPPAAEAATDVRDTQAEVREAVARLPAAQRDVIVLYELLGFTIQDAMETLGWGESRVKVTLFRARRELRGILKGHLSGETGKRTGSK